MPFALALLLAASMALADAPDDAAAGAVIAGPTGAIVAVVRYAGPEADRVVTPSQDVAACGGSRPEGSLVVTDGRLAGVLAWIEGLPGAGPPGAPRRVTLDNAGCAFVPRIAVAAPGDVLHATNLAFDGGGPLANLALPAGGPPRERVLRREGLLTARCDVHEWMRAWILVAPRGRAAVSGAKGELRLEGVPAGEHELRLWHERLGERRVTVSVPAGGVGSVEVAF
jgi:hypothetical protein